MVNSRNGGERPFPLYCSPSSRHRDVHQGVVSGQSDVRSVDLGRLANGREFRAVRTHRPARAGTHFRAARYAQATRPVTFHPPAPAAGCRCRAMAGPDRYR